MNRYDPEEVDNSDVSRDAYFKKHGFRKSKYKFNPIQTKQRLIDIIHYNKRVKSIEEEGFEIFFADTKRGEELQALAEHYIERIAEASRSLHSDYKKYFPDLPWRELYGMRDILTHGYPDVQAFLVWEAITTQIPAFVKGLGLPDDEDGEIALPAELEKQGK